MLLARPRTLQIAAVVLVVAAMVAALARVTAVTGPDHGADTAASTQVASLGSMQAPFSGVQDQFVRVVEAVSPRVVQIQTPTALGSGVVYDARGDVVTNAHVVENASRFTVTLDGGDRHPATLVGFDHAHDIAVVHLSDATPAPAVFSDDATPRIGDLVLAIGNPLGLRSSVTQGIVSSVGRAVSEGNGVTLQPVIQTSAAINPGNSGGALVDLSGEVVGIPTLTALDPQLGNGPAPGIGFAIPSSTVVQIADRLIQSQQR